MALNQNNDGPETVKRLEHSLAPTRNSAGPQSAEYSPSDEAAIKLVYLGIRNIETTAVVSSVPAPRDGTKP